MKERYHGKVPRRPGFDRTGDLEHLVSTGKSAVRKLTHARILLSVMRYGGAHTSVEIVAALEASRRQLLASETIRHRRGQGAIDPKPQPTHPHKIKIKYPGCHKGETSKLYPSIED